LEELGENKLPTNIISLKLGYFFCCKITFPILLKKFKFYVNSSNLQNNIPDTVEKLHIYCLCYGNEPLNCKCYNNIQITNLPLTIKEIKVKNVKTITKIPFGCVVRDKYNCIT
jgi:hypothetical protein